MSDYKTIWETLSKIDVSNHIEKKMNLSYLSWAWAWDTLMKSYPQAQYEFLNNHFHNDGSVDVWVKVSIDDCYRVMWLPVMDNKNNAIKYPDSRKVSDARMRCLVKCIAMFGLGLYIYAGEDLPDGVEPEKKDVAQSATPEKEWYNDFEAHKALMLEGIKSGEKTAASIISKLEMTFKVSKDVKDKIKKLGE